MTKAAPARRTKLNDAPKHPRLEMVRVDALKPFPQNPRRTTPEGLQKLQRSIERFGFTAPVLAQRKTNIVIAGHQRITAAKAAGVARVPVVFLDFDDQEAAAYNVADNRLQEETEWDFGLLSGLLSELDANGFDATLTGFDDKQLEGLLSWTPDPTEAVEEGDVDLTPPKKPESKPGQIYQLGRHRLMCGDSTNVGQVSRLMGGGMAECLWTDPPYGVSYVGKTKDALTIENDGGSGFDEFVRAAFLAADSALAPGGRVYCAVPAGPRNLAFRVAFVGVGWRLHQELVWVKSAMVLGHADYHYRHEPILYGYKPGPGRVGRGNHKGTKWYGDHSQTSVLEFDRPSRSADHPTMKPVGLVAQCLRNSTKPGDKVLDSFGGSGSTLIACEQLSRTAYLMEIDPGYCDVIRRRYEAYAAQKQAVA